MIIIPRNFFYVNQTNQTRGTYGVSIINKTIQFVLDNTSCTGARTVFKEK